MRKSKVMMLLLGLALPWASLAEDSKNEAQLGMATSKIDARVVTYVEEPYTLKEGAFYDHRVLDSIEPQPVNPVTPGLDKLLPLILPSPEPVVPDPIFDVSTGTSLSVPPTPTLGVGETHLVAATSQGVFGFTTTGTAVFGSTLPSFFSPLSPASVSEPRAIYDQRYQRFVVIALDVDSSAPDADLLIAVSDDSDPAGTWYYLKVPTYLPTFDPDGAGPRPAGPHIPSNPMIGMEKNQIYVSFNMHTPNSATFDGTAIWNIWKWQVENATGLYAGNGTTTIQAALRPFSIGNDYANEVPLTPVNLVDGSPAGDSSVNRGILLAGYGGKSISGNPSLQIFWVATVGPTISKMVVPLGAGVDNLGVPLPDAPQPGTSTGIPTGTRDIHSAMWLLPSQLWLATVVVPPSGPDAGEATAHWALVNAAGTSGLTLANQGDVSADQLIDDTYTFNPSIVQVSPELVAVSYSASASNLPLSSMISFISPLCDQTQVALAPDFLRVGTSPWDGGAWGPVSGIGGTGNCVWSHNAHAIAGGGGSWTSSVGKFCVDPGLIFEDGFETGSANGWCLTLP